MKKINIFNRNINSPSYRRTPVSRGFNRGGGIPLFSGMTAVIFALFIATPSFATDPEPASFDARQIVASKAYVDTKQDLIPASLVQIPDYGGEVANQSLVTYDTTNGIVGNEIGIVTQQLMEELGENNIIALEGTGADNLVPTVDAVLNAISSGANNALPTGTTGTVVTYNGTNATTGVQEFGERAVYDPANTYNASTDATKLATMESVKYVCAGYEPAAAGEPAHDGTHPGDEDYCWLWTLPN